MELKINEITQLSPITFNYEELKAELSERVKEYSTVVYTDDKIAEAKSDRAKLRKLITALDDARKEVKKKLLEPYATFEAQINEVKALVEEPVAIIDKQVKEYEQKKKDEKEQAIRELGTDLPEGMTIDRIWNEKWLNTTYSMKQIEADIISAEKKYAEEMEIIQRLKHPVEAEVVYKKTLNIMQAIETSDRIEEAERVKAERAAAEAAAKAEAEAQAQQEVVPEEPKPGFMNPPVVEPEPEDVPRQWVAFKALLSTQEALALKEFFDSHGIMFAPVE